MSYYHKYLIFIIVGLVSMHCGGGASPQATIPAPVAAPTLGAISIAVDTERQVISVSATDGAFSAGAMVTVTNTSATSSGLLELFLPSALAATTATGTANANGGLDTPIEVDGQAGDTIEITQTVDGVTSDPVTQEVGQNTSLALDNRPLAATVNASLMLGYVVHADDELDNVTTDITSFVEVYDITSGTRLDSFTIANSYLVDVETTPQLGRIVLADYLIGSVRTLEIDGTAAGTGLIIQPPYALTMLPNGGNGVGMVGQQDATTSVSTITIGESLGDTPVIGGSVQITHPDEPSASHTATLALSGDLDAGGNGRVMALSLFSNLETVLSVLDPTTPSISLQTVLGTSTYDSVVLFNQSTSVLISDTDNDQIILYSAPTFSTPRTLTVGDKPKGIAVDEDNLKAYVANFGSNTVSVVDLTTGTVEATLTTADGVGLGPFDIGLVGSVDKTLFIANANSSSVSFIELE